MGSLTKEVTIEKGGVAQLESQQQQSVKKPGRGSARSHDQRALSTRASTTQSSHSLATHDVSDAWSACAHMARVMHGVHTLTRRTRQAERTSPHTALRTPSTCGTKPDRAPAHAPMPMHARNLKKRGAISAITPVHMRALE